MKHLISYIALSAPATRRYAEGGVLRISNGIHPTIKSSSRSRRVKESAPIIPSEKLAVLFGWKLIRRGLGSIGTLPGADFDGLNHRLT